MKKVNVQAIIHALIEELVNRFDKYGILEHKYIVYGGMQK